MSSSSRGTSSLVSPAAKLNHQSYRVDPLESDIEYPLDPPPSLHDQLHHAYALDDHRTAKIILLKLKGIVVTDNTDPRIDQVTDADFDAAFCPSGPLRLDPLDEQRIMEGRRKEQELAQERAWADRLAACQRRWEASSAWARREAQRAAAAKHEREQKSTTSEDSSSRSQSSSPPMSVPPPQDTPFTYAFMPMPPPALRPTRSTNPSVVSFKDVLASIRGPLFPTPATASSRHSKQSGHDQSHSRARTITGGISPKTYRAQERDRDRLIASLLRVVHWEAGERRRAKGKDRALDVPTEDATECAACVASASITGETTGAITSDDDEPLSPTSGFHASTTFSRPSSWLSFISGSGSSASTYDTSLDSDDPDACASTPSTSLTSTYTPPSALSTWLQPESESVTKSPRAVAVSLPPPQHTCHQRSRARSSRLQQTTYARSLHIKSSFESVHPSESPLPLHLPLNEPPSDILLPPSKCESGDINKLPDDDQDSISDTTTPAPALLTRFRRSVSALVDLARGVQTAYVRAALSVALSPSPASVHRPPHRRRATNTQSTRPTGARARPADVHAFLLPLPAPSADATPVHFIPLGPRPSPAAVPCTPSPIAATHPRPPRLAAPPPAGSLPYPRHRAIAHPHLLRLRALHNALAAYGVGNGAAYLGGAFPVPVPVDAAERVLGIAWEGRGRSGLGWEVRVGGAE